MTLKNNTQKYLINQPMKKNLLNLLDNIQENQETPTYERYMLIDSLNLFFRNFSAINAVNSNGAHIGGLGGFFRSLGALIRQIQPTQIIMVFDGIGSSTSRKNIIPEYKSGRNVTRVTKHELFDNIDEEDEAKIGQIVRIIQYLKTLPVKTITLGNVEADDVIAYLSGTLPKHENDRVFIVSSDKDYLQLITRQVIVYRPVEREFYTEETVREKFNLDPHNFILYKTLLGDASDALPGIIYARVLHDVELLENKYKIMDLSNPMMSDQDKRDVDNLIQNTPLEFHPEAFVEMYHEDQLGGLIKNVDYWIQDTFKDLLVTQ